MTSWRNALYQSAIVWDAHACLPLEYNGHMSSLQRHREAGATFVSVNVGMDFNPLGQVVRVIAGFRDSGTLVLVDAKRGDIGSTMDAYARAFLADGAPLAGDAVTLSPYLGFGSLEPAVRLAGETGRGVFVLAATSNPEGPTVQRALLAHTVPAERSRTVAQAVVDAAAERNLGLHPLGGIGVVIGATLDRLDLDISALNGPILAPGFGAQGGTVDRLRALFGPTLPGVLPSSSRDVLRHGPRVVDLRDAALRVRDALANGG